MLEWFVVSHRSDGSQKEIPAGYGAFQPLVSGFVSHASVVNLEFPGEDAALFKDKTLPMFKLEVGVLGDHNMARGM
jgi:hypothetical protein